MVLRGLVIVSRVDDHREHFHLVGEFVRDRVKTQEQLESRLDALMTEYAMMHNAEYDAKERTLRISD